jgi:hypothetical protein
VDGTILVFREWCLILVCAIFFLGVPLAIRVLKNKPGFAYFGPLSPAWLKGLQWLARNILQQNNPVG